MNSPFFMIVQNFLEIALLMSIFLGVSYQLYLQKGKAIFLTGFSIFSISILVALLVALLKNQGTNLLPVKNIERLESGLLIGSSIVIVWVTVSLQRYIKNAKRTRAERDKSAFSYFEFDLILFFTAISFLVKEELEMGYFIFSFHRFFLTSALSVLSGSFLGLFLVIGMVLLYKKFRVEKVFLLNTYLLFFLG